MMKQTTVRRVAMRTKLPKKETAKEIGKLTTQHLLNREHASTANATHCRTRRSKHSCSHPANGFVGVTENTGGTCDYRIFTQEYAKKVWRPTRHSKENDHKSRESDRREFCHAFGLYRFENLKGGTHGENGPGRTTCPLSRKALVKIFRPEAGNTRRENRQRFEP